MNPRFSLVIALVLLFGGAGALFYFGSGSGDAGPKPTPITPTPIAVSSAAPTPSPSSEREAEPAPAPTNEDTYPRLFILAVSWMPSFCEVKPNVPECRSDEPRLALHGLWPDGEYCDVSERDRQADLAGHWSALPEVRLSSATSRALDEAMPGTRSHLERHEWLAHGTCAGVSQELYFRRAAELWSAVNGSGVLQVFRDKAGRKLTKSAVSAAFDDAFGDGAGRKVRLSCEETARGDVVEEMTIALYGDAMGGDGFTKMIRAAHQRGGGCEGGIVAE